MELKNILIEITDSIGVVKINRPQALNALNSEVVNELELALHDVEQNADVKVVVITGAGEKAFVAGGDIKEMSTMDPAAARAFSQRGHRLIAFMEQMKKPVIAAVNGYALGGGLELALACHGRVALASAQVGLPEVTLGLIPGSGGTQRLPRLIGPEAALDMILSGQHRSAKDLATSGLFDSSALFNLVLWVEEKIGTPVDPTTFDLVKEWDTVTDVVSFIGKNRR